MLNEIYNRNNFIVYQNSAGHKPKELIERLIDGKYKSKTLLAESNASKKSQAQLNKLHKKIAELDKKLETSLQKVLDENAIKVLVLSIKNAKEIVQTGESLSVKAKKDVIFLASNKPITVTIDTIDKQNNLQKLQVKLNIKLFKETFALYSKLYLKAIRKLAIVGSIKSTLSRLQNNLSESNTEIPNKPLQLLIDKSPLIAKLYANKDTRVKLIAGLAYASALATHLTILTGTAAKEAGNDNNISYEIAKRKLKSIFSAYEKIIKQYNKVMYKELQQLEKGDSKLRKELAKLKDQIKKIKELYSPPKDQQSREQAQTTESLQLNLESLNSQLLYDKTYKRVFESVDYYLQEGLVDLIKSALLKIGKVAFVIGLKIGMVIGWFVDGTLYLIAPFRKALTPIVKPIERAKSFIEQSISSAVYSAMKSYGIPDSIASAVSSKVGNLALGLTGTIISGIPLPAAIKFVIGGYGAIYGTYRVLTEYAEMSLDLKKKADVAATVDNLRQTWDELQSLVDSLTMPDSLDEEIERSIS